MQDIKNKVEAILFTTGRFMEVSEIAALCQVGAIGLVMEALDKLRKDYENRDNALCIIEENNKWKLNIKKEYSYLTSKLLSETEFDRPTQETLAVIAYKNPALQSEVIKIRGNKAYDHIKLLAENQFITSEKKGRTRLLKLTSKFFEYFDIVEEQIKDSMENIGKNIRHAIEKKEEIKEGGK